MKGRLPVRKVWQEVKPKWPYKGSKIEVEGGDVIESSEEFVGCI
jgi:hypothetical protein